MVAENNKNPDKRLVSKLASVNCLIATLTLAKEEPVAVETVQVLNKRIHIMGLTLCIRTQTQN